MPSLSRAGEFLAKIIEHGVAETGPNSLPTWQARYEVTHELSDGEWTDVPAEHITGWHYLAKRDGSINETTIDQIVKAIGWGGTDVAELDGMDLSQTVVRLTVETDTYQNKTRQKVAWLKHREDDSAGGIKRLDKTGLRALQNKFGGKLKAAAGGTAAPARPPTGAPKPVAPAKKPAALTHDTAWQAFHAAFKGTHPAATDEHISSEWFRLAATVRDDVGPDEFDEKGLRELVELGKKAGVPF